jgi:hypothetical protein
MKPTRFAKVSNIVRFRLSFYRIPVSFATVFHPFLSKKGQQFPVVSGILPVVNPRGELRSRTSASRDGFRNQTQSQRARSPGIPGRHSRSEWLKPIARCEALRGLAVPSCPGCVPVLADRLETWVLSEGSFWTGPVWETPGTSLPGTSLPSQRNELAGTRGGSLGMRVGGLSGPGGRTYTLKRSYRGC